MNEAAPVCSTQVTDADATSCLDPAAPTGDQEYYVVALGPPRPPSTTVDRSAVGTLVKTEGNEPPTPPSVTATPLPGGGVQLTWTAATDPEGRPLRYYRIYLDSDTAYTARFDRTDSGSTLVWTDESSGASSHRIG